MPFELKTPVKTALAPSATIADGSASLCRPLVLSGRVGVQQARALWEALQPALEARQAVDLHAESVEEIDTSILQILCRVFLGGRMTIATTSQGFLDALERRGLQRFFAVPAAAVTPQPGSAAGVVLRTSPSTAVVSASPSRRKRANG